MTIEIELEAGDKGFLDNEDKSYESLIEEVIMAVMDYEECPYEAEVNVILTDDESICEINRLHRDIDKATDVLSFPMIDYQTPGDFDHVEDAGFHYFNPESGELILGDIILSIDKVKAQAESYGHSRSRELAFLTAHSMLHLFGYDHIEDSERIVMEKRQEEILKRLGIAR